VSFVAHLGAHPAGRLRCAVGAAWATLGTPQLMALSTPRHHGLGAHGAGPTWSALVEGQKFATSGHYNPTATRLPRWAGQKRRSGSDDVVAYRAPTCAWLQKRAHQRRNALAAN
jgi:hypothetical protein